MTPETDLRDLSRNNRRAIGNAIPNPNRLKLYPQNIGECFYCGDYVFAAPGQAITYKIITDKNGKSVSIPTHKACRKNA